LRSKNSAAENRLQQCCHQLFVSSKCYSVDLNFWGQEVNASYCLHRNYFHCLCNVYCFIKNMQTSQGNDFELINKFNTLTLGAFSRCRVNDAWRPFNILGALIKWRKTKCLATTNLGISEVSTLKIYWIFLFPLSVDFTFLKILKKA
jgi:hypothetical protein